MKIMILIQARMSSKRFPEKMLYKINNKPLIEIVNENCKKSNLNTSVITSTDKTDQKLVRYLKKNKINFFRSSLQNVYKRFCDTIKFYKLTHFVRITGDSPLVNYRLIKKMTSDNLLKNYDLITNCFPRTYPIGQTIEVFNARIFLKNYKFMTNSFYREHISQFFYENYKNYKIKNFKLKKNLSKLNLSINYKSDVKRIKQKI